MNTLEQIKDEVANEFYGVLGWFMLTDAQKSILVDKVAYCWAEQSIRSIISNTVIQAA